MKGTKNNKYVQARHIEDLTYWNGYKGLTGASYQWHDSDMTYDGAILDLRVMKCDLLTILLEGKDDDEF